jgi:hypothetical protein
VVSLQGAEINCDKTLLRELYLLKFLPYFFLERNRTLDYVHTGTSLETGYISFVPRWNMNICQSAILIGFYLSIRLKMAQ